MSGLTLTAVVVFFVAPWAYLSVYLRYVFAALFVIGLIYSARSWKEWPLSAPVTGKWFIAGRIMLIGIAALFVVDWALSYVYPAERLVDINFPFKGNKSYYVMQGGGSRISNPAHRNFSVDRYGYAMDLAALYSTGNRAKGLHPKELSSYAIYGDTVFSPCAGHVIQIHDGMPENEPGTYHDEISHGNHVIIQSKGFRVFMAHFIPGSIQVKIGQEVKVGDHIGRVGNAGFSAEPHLHLNILANYPRQKESQTILDSLAILNPFVERGKNWGRIYPYDGVSVPFSFNGKFYSINDQIRPRH